MSEFKMGAEYECNRLTPKIARLEQERDAARAECAAERAKREAAEEFRDVRMETAADVRAVLDRLAKMEAVVAAAKRILKWLEPDYESIARDGLQKALDALEDDHASATKPPEGSE